MNNKSFDNHYKKNYRNLLFFAQNLTQSKSDAKDLLQDSSIKAIENINSLKSKDKFLPWFQRIIYSTFITAYHKRKRRKEILSNISPNQNALLKGTSVKNKAISQLKRKDFNKVFKKIKKKYREAFRLYFIGYSYNEISEIQGVPVGTVKSRIFTARNLAKKIIDQAA